MNLPAANVVRGILMASAIFMISQSSQANDIDYEDRDVTFGLRGQAFNPKETGGESDWSGGAQLRFYFTNSFAVEGSIDYRKEEFGQTDLHIYPVQASLLAYIIEAKPVGVFALAGPGWYYTTIDPPNAEDDSDHRFGFHAGGGVEFRISNQWSVDGTYRYIWLEEAETQDQSITNRDFDDSGHMFTAAVNYNF